MNNVMMYIVNQMTDFVPTWEHIHVAMKFSTRFDLLGHRDAGLIVVFPFSVVLDLRDKHGKGVFSQAGCLVGKEMLRTIAHEFRHEQQELLWDTNIPHVALENTENEDLGFAPIEKRSAKARASYWRDPGEVDARDFAERCVEAAPIGILSVLQKYAECFTKEHFEEFRAAISK